MMLKSSWFLCLLLVTGISSCVYHDLDEVVGVAETDSTLFSQMQSTTGYHYYKEGVILDPAQASPHTQFKLRFNQIAWAALDESGELPVGATFPEGSIIVKEVHTSGSLTLYAVIKKGSVHPDAAKGWLWAEYRIDGGVAYGIGQKGIGCTSCHSSGTHRDFVRTFDLH
jgi:hypothetical protein